MISPLIEALIHLTATASVFSFFYTIRLLKSLCQQNYKKSLPRLSEAHLPVRLIPLDLLIALAVTARKPTEYCFIDAVR